MTTTQSSRSMLTAAAAVILVALVCLVLGSILLTLRVDTLTTETERLADPARRHLNTVDHELTLQIAAIARHAITASPQHIADYKTHIAGQEKAMRELATVTAALGEPFASDFIELQRQIDRWHETVSWSLEARTRGESLAGQRVPYEVTYPAAIDALRRLDDSVERFQASRRMQIRDLSRIAVVGSLALVLVALAAAFMIHRIARRLRASASALEALIRSRDEILGIVSHDLRSPLTTIVLSSQLMEGSSPEEQAEHIATIRDTTRRMNRLIQDLLDVTKIENSSLSIRQEQFDPAVAADEVVASHEPIAAQKKISLAASIDRPLPPIIGDQDRLVQALSNLIGNALKFTPDNGTVYFETRQRDGTIEFTVTDTGPGIAENDLPRIFDPFYQAKKTAHLGAGLGLKITRAIVEAHGGTIAVANLPPRGACFTISLPAATRA